MQATKKDPISVNDLFGPDVIVDGRTENIFNVLGKYGILDLAYDGDIGCNPGYIFRGEAAFEYPLQSSLERSLRKKLGTSVSIDGEMLRAEELQSISCFAEGPSGRVASIFHPDGKVGHDHPKKDVFWWLSLMQHYGLPTRLLDFTRDIRVALYFAIEQHARHILNHGVKKDLIIYCFPCKNLDLTTPFDPDNNKCPFKLAAGYTDMNLTVGCQIGLLWMKQHQSDFQKYLERKRTDQAWGWDMPYHQNPRLKSQKGMFFYPFDYPSAASPLTATGPSWFVQNLSLQKKDRFNLRNFANDRPPKRIRIKSAHAEKLRTHLDQEYQISRETIYERYTLTL